MKTNIITSETAQRKTWLAERKALFAGIRLIERETRKELGTIDRQIKALTKAKTKLLKRQPTSTQAALRRIAILNGRLGL